MTNNSFETGFTVGMLIGGSMAKTQELTVYENGEYIAKDDGCTGYSKVIVDVPDRYDEGYRAGYTDGFKNAMKYNNGEYDNTEVEDDSGGTYTFPDGALPIISNGTPTDDIGNGTDLLFSMTGGDGAVTNTSNGWSLMQYTKRTDTSLSIKLVLRNARTGEEQQMYSIGTSIGGSSTSTNHSYVGSIGNVTAGGLTWTVTYDCIASAGEPYERISTINCKVGRNNWSRAWREFIGGGNYYVGGAPTYTPAA